MNDFLAPPCAGLLLCFLHIKSHRDIVVAQFNFTANFARSRRSSFLLSETENSANLLIFQRKYGTLFVASHYYER